MHVTCSRQALPSNKQNKVAAKVHVLTVLMRLQAESAEQHNHVLYETPTCEVAAPLGCSTRNWKMQLCLLGSLWRPKSCTRGFPLLCRSWRSAA
jgi:hypothetical protein